MSYTFSGSFNLIEFFSSLFAYPVETLHGFIALQLKGGVQMKHS